MKITRAQLKTLIQEELETVLLERETDQVYSELLFLFNLFFLDSDKLEIIPGKTNPALSTAHKDLLDRTLNPIRYRLLKKLLGGDGKHIQLKPEAVEEALGEAKDIPGIDKVFQNDETIERLFETKINFAYESKDSHLRRALGWFDHRTGEVSLNFASPDFLDHIPGSKKDFDKLTESELIEVIISNENALKTTFEHEMTHMINYHRAGAIYPARSKVPNKAIKSVMAKSPGRLPPKLYKQLVLYANSTEEIQARLAHLLADVENNVARYQSGIDIQFNRPPKTIDDRLDIWARKEPRGFVKLRQLYEKIGKLAVDEEPTNETLKKIIVSLIDAYNTYYPNYWPVATPQTKKRIQNRLFQFANVLINRYNK